MAPRSVFDEAATTPRGLKGLEKRFWAAAERTAPRGGMLWALLMLLVLPATLDARQEAQNNCSSIWPAGPLQGQFQRDYRMLPPCELPLPVIPHPLEPMSCKVVSRSFLVSSCREGREAQIR